MVIALTGTQSINKKFIARLLIAKLNKFEYNGYYCDFSNFNYEIFDSNDQLVYTPHTEENEKSVDKLLHVEGGPEVIKHFDDLNEGFFQEGIRHNHFIDTFSDISHEYGLFEKPSYLLFETALIHPNSFEDVINNIQNSDLNVKVISGTFGNHFLDNLKETLNEEVKIVNIIRNPSVSYLMNKKPESNWETDINPDLTEKIDYERFFDAILNALEIMKRDDVTTVKFEDMMRYGKLEFEDIRIDTRDDFLCYNDYINKYENSIEVLMDDAEFAPFNDLVSNFTADVFFNPWGENDSEEELPNMTKEEVLAKLSDYFPINMFESLGYSPATKQEILDPIK